MTEKMTGVECIENKFKSLKAQGRSALIPFIMAGYPDFDTSFAMMKAFPKAGADIIELGMPFSDPVGDGPAIRKAAEISLKQGTNLKMILEMVCKFRVQDKTTPIILMGYYNPIHFYGIERFLTDASTAGVSGFIIGDLPREEDAVFCLPAVRKHASFIHLISPLTNESRLPYILENASGFVYYISVKGITGTRLANADDVKYRIELIQSKTTLPVCVGFGIRSPEQAKAIAGIADGVVIGSEISERLAGGESVSDIMAFIREMAQSVH
jgi:tryptophan synthase alpha chain